MAGFGRTVEGEDAELLAIESLSAEPGPSSGPIASAKGRGTRPEMITRFLRQGRTNSTGGMVEQEKWVFGEHGTGTGRLTLTPPG